MVLFSMSPFEEDGCNKMQDVCHTVGLYDAVCGCSTVCWNVGPPGSECQVAGYSRENTTVMMSPVCHNEKN